MSFDRLAGCYPALEFVLAGNLLQRCRTAFLDQAASAGSILLVGEGHGRFLEAVRRVNPRAFITVVEESAGMMRTGRERLSRSGLSTERTAFVQRSIAEFESSDRFELIATHFFLDCFEGEALRKIAQKLAGMLAAKGTWIVSDFHLPERGWQRVRARTVLFLAYGFFRVATKLPARRLEAPAGILREAGLEPVDRRAFNHGLLYAEVWRKRSAGAE